MCFAWLSKHQADVLGRLQRFVKEYMLRRPRPNMEMHLMDVHCSLSRISYWLSTFFLFFILMWRPADSSWPFIELKQLHSCDIHPIFDLIKWKPKHKWSGQEWTLLFCAIIIQCSKCVLYSRILHMDFFLRTQGYKIHNRWLITFYKNTWTQRLYTHFRSRVVLSTASRFAFHPAEVYSVFVCVRDRKKGVIHSKPPLPLV